MDEKFEGLSKRRRLAVETRLVGRAVGAVGASVAVLSAGAEPASTFAGLGVMVVGAAVALLSEWWLGLMETRLDRGRAWLRLGRAGTRPARVPRLQRNGSQGGGGGIAGSTAGTPQAEAGVMDPRILASLWELGLRFDLRRALRRVTSSRPGADAEALAKASVLLPGTVVHVDDGHALERLVLCMPDMLVLLRDEDLRSGDPVGRIPLMVPAREYRTCTFWLPEGRALRTPVSSPLVYASSPDGDIYMVLGVARGDTLRIRFRCTRWPEGPVRERLWEEFEKAAALVGSAVVTRRPSPRSPVQ